MKKLILLVFVFLLCFDAEFAQTKRGKRKVVGSKPIAVVTIAGKLPPPVPLPVETDAGIWNEYKNDEFDFSICFPSKTEDVLDENNVSDLTDFSAETKNATYRVMTQRIAANLDNRAIDALLEDIFRDLFDPRKSRLISKRNVGFRDKLGKEFVTEDTVFGGKEKRINFMRAFVIEGKSFVLNVSVRKTADFAEMEKWALKFLDSFAVKISEKTLS